MRNLHASLVFATLLLSAAPAFAGPPPDVSTTAAKNADPNVDDNDVTTDDDGTGIEDDQAVNAAEEADAPPPNPGTGSEQIVTGVNDGSLDYNFGQHPLVNVADGDIQVSAENSTIAPRSGYMPLQVFVRNVGKEAEPVRLEFTWRGTGSATIRRDVTVAAKGRVAVTIPVPSGATYGTLTARAKGITDGGTQSLYFTQAQQAILAIGTEERFQKTARRPPNYNSYNTYVRAIAPEDAPTELASYVGFNEVVVLTPLEDLNEATRRALESYAATGGTLIVSRPSRVAKKELPLLSSDEPAIHDYGFGSVRLCGRDELACANALANDLPLAQKVVKPYTPQQSLNRYAYDASGNAIPEAEKFLLPQATAPVGRFLLIILAFTLAIGPGSVWVARRRGPPMLLLTIPGTALVTCLLIVGYSVVVDGFSIHAATRGYTLLDSKNKRAITVGVEAFYANIAPGDATYDLSSAIVSPGAEYGGEQVPSIDWTQGAKFDTDFIPSRTYREWGVISVAPTRARLVVKVLNDGVEVQNALGSDIRVARVNVKGAEWIVRSLKDGGSARAEAAGSGAPADIPEPGLNEYATRFDSRAPLRTKGALTDGEFVAQVEGPSMLPEGGLRLSHHSSEQIIRGEVER